MSGWGNVIDGCAALLAAYVLRVRAARSRNERPATRAPVKKVSRTERIIEHGGPYAFGAGVVLNIFPGIFPFIALRTISSLSYGNGAKILLIIGLYLCTFVDRGPAGRAAGRAGARRTVGARPPQLARSQREAHRDRRARSGRPNSARPWNRAAGRGMNFNGERTPQPGRGRA